MIDWESGNNYSSIKNNKLSQPKIADFIAVSS